MKTTIYLVRHGLVYNPDKIFYGRLPRYRLDEAGITGILDTARHMKRLPIQFVYASPLLRARQTAAIIRETVQAPRMSLSRLLLEIKSSNQGSVFDYNQGVVRDLYSPPVWKPGDERMEDIRDRMLKFIGRIARYHSGHHIVAVSHGDPLMILRASLEGKPMSIASIRPDRSHYIRHGEVWRVTVDGDVVAIDDFYKPPVL